jgi:hypothetical protein
LKKDLPIEENKKSAFDDIDSIISKEFDDLIDLTKVDTRIRTWLDIGVYALNYACSKNIFGAIPIGRVSSIKGLTGTGKSLMLASLMKDPKLDYVLIIETEGGGSSEELYNFAGVDISKLRMLKGQTFENYRIKLKDSKIEEVPDSKFPKNKKTKDYIYVEGITRMVKKFINTIVFNDVKKNILVILDSLGNTQSVRELSGTSDMGARAKGIATFFRNFDLAFEKTNIAFVFSNKLYMNIGNQFQPYAETGGVNVAYNPSLSIELWDTSVTDDISDTEMKKERDRRATSLGSSIKTIRAKIAKSRFGTELRTCYFLIDFSGKGPARYSGLFKLCRDFGIIEKSGGAYYWMPDVLEDKFMKKNFIDLIRKNEKENLDKIQKALELAEERIMNKGQELQVNDESEIIDDLDEDDYTDMKNEMLKEIEG